MEIVKKRFDELTTRQLYELLKARSEIFVVEQDCVYQDLDGIDYCSLHVFFEEEDGSVSAYLRLFEKDPVRKCVQMGRVLTRTHGSGLGGKILSEGIRAAALDLGANEIFIEAQVYATGFYRREGFEICSEEFLEDGIPHVQMVLKITNETM